MTPYRIWQLVDSAFPAGSFAHSSGLEAAFRLGVVGDDLALHHYLVQQIEHAGCFLLPFVGAAHADPCRIAELDARLDASTTNHVANRASRAQGQAFIAAASAAFNAAPLIEIRADCRQGRLTGHLAVMFGAALAIVEVGRADAERLLLYQHLRNVMASAVRLNLVGPMEAQSIVARLGPALESSWERHHELPLDDAAQPAPLLDLWQGHHDRLYSRLFSS